MQNEMEHGIELGSPYDVSFEASAKEEGQRNMGLNHLACIMDGNRRWAQNQGLLPWLGHKRGLETIDRVIDFCLQKNISYLSLYTFSTENLQRSEEEKS